MFDDQGAAPMSDATGPREPDQAERDLVGKIVARIRDDRKHHEKAFKQMREDMKIARTGKADPNWPEANYTANITGRHINQKVSALYAKNPKAVARRRDRLDFAVWDESEATLMTAVQTVQMAAQVPPDPMTGMSTAMADPMFIEAQMLLQDVEQGMRNRDQMKRIGKTLELLFDYYTKEQSPLDFKTSMKQVVRRAATTCVGYVKIGFQREFDQDPAVEQRLKDFQQQLQYLQDLAARAQDAEDGNTEAQQREIEVIVRSLEKQQYVLVREGLVFDFPDSIRVIPDKLTRHLVGFVGARWVTVEHAYTPDQVKATFKVDLGSSYRRYMSDGTFYEDLDQPRLDLDSEDRKADQVCVWEHYDRQAGVVYLVCDGYPGFLREPGPPEVYVEDFWPVYALTFNDVEDTDCLYPPSDVALMKHMQAEYNRSRQGLREHRQAARPRFATPKGALGDETKQLLQNCKPFEVVEFEIIAADPDIRKIIQPIPVPGVDPNLYDTSPMFTDIQLVIGAQEATFGGIGGATATESSIAESSRVASVDSNVDDLDGFLTRIARASGQVLLREMSPEQVKKIAGPGAMWPQMSLDEIAQELYLEVVAGSSGRPNQAVEMANWERMLPFLVQMPGLQPSWLARETLTRLDDKMDLTEALTEGLPAIVALNRMMGATPAPGAAPEDQGGAGADNAPAGPAGPPGTPAPMGNNQM